MPVEEPTIVTQAGPRFPLRNIIDYYPQADAEFFYNEEGLSLTDVLTEGEHSPYDFSIRNDNIVFACEVALPQAAIDGCLFEAGGSSSGLWVGLISGDFVIKTLDLTLTVLLEMDEKIHRFLWEILVSPLQFRLWVDDVLVGFAQNLSYSGQWTGSGSMGYLQVGTITLPGVPVTPWPNLVGASNLRVYAGAQVSKAVEFEIPVGTVNIIGQGISVNLVSFVIDPALISATGQDITITPNKILDLEVIEIEIEGQTIEGSGYGNDANTVLLLQMTSPAFEDQSASGHSTSTQGTVDQDTVNYKFAPGSAEFDGDGIILIPDHADFNFGAGDWTIDFWVKLDQVNNPQIIYNQGTITAFSVTTGPIKISVEGGEVLFSLSSNNNSWDLAEDLVIGAVSAGVWYHIALVRDGITVRSFKDGVAGATAAVAATALYNSTASLQIGGATVLSSDPEIPPSVGDGLDGLIDEFRISDIARVTTAFTPPTTPYE